MQERGGRLGPAGREYAEEPAGLVEYQQVVGQAVSRRLHLRGNVGGDWLEGKT